MPVRAQCPHCDQSYQLREELVGKTVRCKGCGETFSVLQPAEADDAFEVVHEDDEELPPVPSPKSSRGRTIPRKVKKSSDSNTLKWVFGCLGVGVLTFVVLCAGLIFLGKRAARELADEVREQQRQLQQQQQQQQALANADIPDAGGPSELYPLDRYPMPEFPQLGTGELLPDSNVTFQFVQIPAPPEKLNQPGFQTQMRVYLPAGEHAPGTLPLVLVAPAGTPLFTGNELDDGDYHDETLPYAEAGAVVIMYSLDGPADSDEATDAQLGLAYQRFRNAGAGTVNARVALEFALKRIPSVDPQKIVVAGHSSAGTLSMLYAAHEPRLAAAIAYCPCTDVPSRMGDFITAVQGQPLFAGVTEFFQKSSPTTHGARISCPVFIFHALDDSNCPYSESERFVAQLKAAGKDIELSEPPAYGDHYQPMIDQGIPRAITWLRKRQILPQE